MSLYRLAYYSTILGGWAALVAWAAAELVVLRTPFGGSWLGVGVAGAIVGAAIGVGISIVPSLANAQWKQLLPSSLPGLIGGLLGGGCGSIVGNALYSLLGFPRALGWMIMGLGIGVAEGIYERSPVKIRNGLIGGGLGGLIGGVLFDPILNWIQSGTGMSSRATAFVILGLSIGALIGLVQVVLKDAWLTVVDGYRSGRQLILIQPVTTLGRADYLALPFGGEMSRDVEPEHARIRRESNGTFTLEDIQSRVGTRLNGQVIQAAATLKDGDFIKLGSNLIRFNLRARESGAAIPASPAATPVAVPQAPPPPTIRKAAPAGAAPIAPPPRPSPPVTSPVKMPSAVPAPPVPSRPVPSSPSLAPPPPPTMRPSLAVPSKPAPPKPALSNPSAANPLAPSPPAPAPPAPKPLAPAPPIANRPGTAIPAPPPPPPKRHSN